MINERAKAILEFCFVKTQLEQWFQKSEKFDKILKNNFMTDYMKAINNDLIFFLFFSKKLTFK